MIKTLIHKPPSAILKVHMTKQKSALELFCLYKAVHAWGHRQHACTALTFLAKLHQSSVSLCLIVHYGSPHRDKQSASYLRTEVTSPPLILSQGAHWHSQSLPAPAMGRLCGPLQNMAQEVLARGVAQHWLPHAFTGTYTPRLQRQTN